jgi:hypothetical protein
MNRVRLVISIMCLASVLAFAFGLKSQVARADESGECQCCNAKECGNYCYGGVACCAANCYLITE